MKSKTEWIRFSNKFLIVSGVLAIICAIVVRRQIPTYTQAKVMTGNQCIDYRSAMNQYHDRYGRFPVHCTNVIELARMLSGEDVNGDNPDQAVFFASKMSLKKRVHDKFGFPFELSVSADDSGTNFILRSYGRKKFREHRIKTSTPIAQMNISELHTQTLARVEAELRTQTQANSLTGTNQSVTEKETNHVNSISQ
jgi:hypothetical protein